MLEPVFRTRTGIALNTLGVFASLFAIPLDETVTTASGFVPLTILMPFVAGAFGVRAAGCAFADREADTSMGWGWRIFSWLLFGVAGVLLGLTGSMAAIVGLGAFVVLDAAGALAKQKPAGKPPRRRRRGGIWARMKVPLLVGLYLTLTAIVHFSVSVYLPFGTLVTWSMLAFGFALLLRFSLAGPKADESHLRPPVGMRRHERREERVADPQRERAEEILLTLRAQGDAGPFLALVAQAARDADLPEREIQALQERILASFARAGTRRDEDIHAALAEVESYLSTTRREVAV